jgi:hypothetical protein
MPSMALKPLTPAINSRPPLPSAPPVPIKGRGAPPAITTPHLALSRSLPSPQLLLTTVARPPQRRPSSGETQAEFPSLPSPLCAPAGELWRTGAAGGQALLSAPPCPLSVPPWVHGAPPDRDPEHGINRWKIIRYSDYFGNLAKRSLDFCKINLWSRFCRFCTQTPRVFRN